METKERKDRAASPCSELWEAPLSLANQNQGVSSASLSVSLHLALTSGFQAVLSSAQGRPKGETGSIHHQFSGTWNPGASYPPIHLLVLTVQRLHIAVPYTLLRFYSQWETEAAMGLLHLSWNWNTVRF